MQTAKFIHEGGLTAHSIEQARAIVERHNVHPVLLVESRPTGGLDLLLGRDGAVLGVQASTLYSAPSADGLLLLKIFALAYDVGAAVYHCVSLAKAYESIVSDYERIRRIPGFTGSDSDWASFGYRSEPYYELDALLSAARRVYDKVGHCVWHAFEGRGGGMPDNMAGLVPRLAFCPAPLAKRLQQSWAKVGQRLKSYRDCTQHFASTDMGLGTVRP